MAKYVVLSDLDELARKASDPEVRKLIEEAFSDESWSTDQQSTSTDTPKAETPDETESGTPTSPRPERNDEDFFRELKAEPASYWDDLLRKMFGPDGGGAQEPPET